MCVWPQPFVSPAAERSHKVHSRPVEAGVVCIITREVVIEAPEKKLFTITRRDESETVRGRMAAVEKARELSKRTFRPVEVERKDERVHMTYRRGRLQSYQFDTRGHRRRRRA